MSQYFNRVYASTATTGTGTITMGSAVSGFRAFSIIPSNCATYYMIEDGSNWEYGIGVWNGTTLTRGVRKSNAALSSNLYQPINLSGSAKVFVSLLADNIIPMAGNYAQWQAVPQVTTVTGTLTGWAAPTLVGTGGTVTPAVTNYFTTQHRSSITSATTANAWAEMRIANGLYTFGAVTNAMGSGFVFLGRFGIFTTVTNMQIMCGMGPTGAWNAAVATQTNAIWVGKVAADTTLGFYTNDGSGTATKQADFGANFPTPTGGDDFYEVMIEYDPRDSSVDAYITRYATDSGGVRIFHQGATASTDLPAAGTALYPHMGAGLTSTTGTACVFHPQTMQVRTF